MNDFPFRRVPVAKNCLERTRRQIAETEQRIHQQSCLIDRLRRNGHARMLPEAERFLARLVLIQATFEGQLLPAALGYLGELQRYQERVKACLRQLDGHRTAGLGRSTLWHGCQPKRPPWTDL
jgi:hypothetical protein